MTAITILILSSLSPDVHGLLAMRLGYKLFLHMSKTSISESAIDSSSYASVEIKKGICKLTAFRLSNALSDGHPIRLDGLYLSAMIPTCCIDGGK